MQVAWAPWKPWGICVQEGFINKYHEDIDIAQALNDFPLWICVIVIYLSISEESDLDEDKKLSEVEFELMLSKSPDFLG